MSRAHHFLAASIFAVAALVASLPQPVVGEEPAVSLATHPYHVSRAEVEFNFTTGKFQVALCVWPEDLETAISKLAQRSVNLDTDDEVDQLISRYIASKFSIVNANADANANGIEEASNVEQSDGEVEAEETEPVSTEPDVTDSASVESDEVAVEPLTELPAGFRWVGHEIELKQAWLYFEIDGDFDTDGEQMDWTISNQVFFELNDDQFNQIQIGRGRKMVSKACEPASPQIAWSASNENIIEK